LADKKLKLTKVTHGKSNPPEEEPMEDHREKAIEILNRVVELELAGAVRYTQYSLMIFGHDLRPCADSDYALDAPTSI
jgi:hypothetical protein